MAGLPSRRKRGTIRWTDFLLTFVTAGYNARERAITADAEIQREEEELLERKKEKTDSMPRKKL
ncbi:hypothetical protein F4677DRAFT_401824 [Hypoxylon crocopeplum]|nr:hypothetical protein F4677DRAFT_401824 [Hypoxylon crocopeplum]